MAKTSPLKMLRRGIRFSSIKKHFRKHRRLLFHAIIFSGIFAGAAFFIKDAEWFFPAIVAVALVLGILQIWVLYSEDYEWADRFGGNGIKEAVLTLGVNIFGAVAVYFIFLSSKNENFAEIATGATLVFSLPFFLDRAFYANLLIPKKKYEPLIVRTTVDIVGRVNIQPCGEGIFFHFSSFDDLPDLPDTTKRMYMPQQKDIHSLETILKAFIHFYNNEINPSNPIRLGRKTDEEVQFFKWFLAKQAIPFLPGRKIIDPKKTIEENGFRYRKWSGKDASGMQINLRCIDIYIERSQ